MNRTEKGLTQASALALFRFNSSTNKTKKNGIGIQVL